MPQGNAGVVPPGLWYNPVTTSSIPKLVRGSLLQLFGVCFMFYALSEHRSLAYKYTYTDFIGKTMSMGKLTVLTHEPLSAEEVDRLKAEQKNSH